MTATLAPVDAQINVVAEPVLQPPGAGLAPRQAAVSRRLFPVMCALFTRPDASRLFFNEGRRIVRLAQCLSPAQLTTRVLVEPLWGIEDSSRFWSVSMTLEHLIIVGTAVAEAELCLSRHEQPARKADIAAVKPSGALGERAIAHYRKFLKRFAKRVPGELANLKSPDTFEHPWFGPLTAQQWHCLAALHQTIHRRQIQKIIAGLPQPAA